MEISQSVFRIHRNLATGLPLLRLVQIVGQSTRLLITFQPPFRQIHTEVIELGKPGWSNVGPRTASLFGVKKRSAFFVGRLKARPRAAALRYGCQTPLVSDRRLAQTPYNSDLILQRRLFEL
jgi:hypothetical protein